MKQEREFFWECKGGMLKLKEDDISYIHTAQRKTYLHTRERIYQIRSTLKQEEEKLKDIPVIRVHQGYLVHMADIESLIKNDVILRSGERIPVSEKRKKYVAAEVRAYVMKEGKYKKCSK